MTLGISYESGGDEKIKPSANRPKKRMAYYSCWRNDGACRQEPPSKSLINNIWNPSRFSKKSQRSANQRDKTSFLFPFPLGEGKHNSQLLRPPRTKATNCQQEDFENPQPASDCDNANDPKQQTQAKFQSRKLPCSTWLSRKATFARPACRRLIEKV